jgi:hypothetical protein
MTIGRILRERSEAVQAIGRAWEGVHGAQGGGEPPSGLFFLENLPVSGRAWQSGGLKTAGARLMNSRAVV